ncbi:response regulator [Denitromonas iodatirespirans]|uniref:Sensory/regulatory protein RpfC n=1 Tax=Denitromonas iodatirespirans TaxID=2795389 RepID=A0A944DP00_DENI1|nr:response regulator [Denitromonas iodatirespirans]MBT0962059.1 response regulator [Denitromonas iodatirespirans]
MAKKPAPPLPAPSPADLLDNLDELVFETDATLRWTYLNAAWQRLTGQPPAQALGRHALARLPAQARAALREALARQAGTDAAMAEHTVSCPSADAQPRRLRLRLRARRADDGSVLGWAGTAADVTAQSHAEQMLDEARALAQAAHQTKSDFLANMSHEIRTPMNAIIGMTDLALETRLDGEQREYLTLVKNAADNLLSLVNDLLDFSRIESGKLDFEHIGFGLRDCVALSHRTLQDAAERQGLALTYHVAPTVPDHLVGDPHRLRQVLLNLIGNALKFTEHGHIAVHVDLAESHPDSAVLQFSVEDSGIGIAEDKQHLIFQAFAQADTSSTRRFGGAGLGLAICAQLVGRMHGRLWVDSTPGHGSTFHFTARFDRDRTPALLLPADADLKALRILVVAGNEASRSHLTGMIESWHMLCDSCASGTEALAGLTGDAPEVAYHAIVADTDLGDMSAFRFFEALNARPGQHAPVRLMTANAGQRGDAARCRKLGIQAYLSRPIEPSDLLDAILLAVGADGLGPLITRHSLREKRRRLNVLLAEDNKVNQMLALRLLDKLGHATQVVSNGREALAACENTHFDVILMDVQMPEMGGFEATARLREREAARGHYTPVIAMTAHAMPGDRERCLAAGMDDDVPKPVQPTALATALAAVTRGQPPLRPTDIVATTFDNPLAVFDRDALLANLGGDETLMQELAGLYLKDEAGLRQHFDSARQSGDLQAIHAAVHALKGAIANFSADSAVAAATALEGLCRDGQAEGLAPALSHFDTELDRFAEALRSVAA